MKELKREHIRNVLQRMIVAEPDDNEPRAAFFRMQLAAIDRLAKLENWFTMPSQNALYEQMQLNFESELTPEKMESYLSNRIESEPHDT